MEKAGELYFKAANLGEPLAMTYVAAMYSEGRGGFTKDEKKAVEFFRQAANLGEPMAMAGLSSMYDAGRGGLAVDPQEALQWYRKAVAGGFAGCKKRIEELEKAGY